MAQEEDATQIGEPKYNRMKSVNVIYTISACDTNPINACLPDGVVEPRAGHYMEEDEDIIDEDERKRIVIFVSGTGNPYFSTDTTAALRASEVSADIILKATKVDGIYDKDPHKYNDAQKFSELTYMDCLEKRLSVMDSTAFSLCMDNRMPILVFNLQEEGSIRKAVCGESIGTTVR